MDRIDDQLAMVVDLLTRATAGQITLTPQDRQLMADMMHSSDSDAADSLWARFGGPAAARLQRHLPDDLDRLMNYTLGPCRPPSRP